MRIRRRKRRNLLKFEIKINSQNTKIKYKKWRLVNGGPNSGAENGDKAEHGEPDATDEHQLTVTASLAASASAFSTRHKWRPIDRHQLQIGHRRNTRKLAESFV